MHMPHTIAMSRSHRLLNRDCIELVQRLSAESIDATITSPPYCIGKDYENETSTEDFVANHTKLLPEIVRITKPGGSICWQVGYHISNGVVTPLDYIIHQLMAKHPEMKLRNRIIWTFGHGLHPQKRFSGRHETILWFTKGSDYSFNLDAVRVQQRYPGKRAYKGDKKGQLSGNPLGKNPSDVWDLPNVKAQHPEKTDHPCQFPIALAERLIKAVTKSGDIVFDPYMGSGTTAVAAFNLGRRFLGAEINRDYFEICKDRLALARKGLLPQRGDGKPVYNPESRTRLTQPPPEWKEYSAK